VGRVAKGRGCIVPHRRRRDLKTNYRGRLKLLRSGKPRLVVRKSLNNMLCQIIGYRAAGDVCLVSADSKELKKFGWQARGGNVPAAYLTGLLCGVRAKKKNIGEAVLDIGMYESTKGGRLYAALHGVLDAGVGVPHSADILPDDNRLKGAHIVSYAEWLKKENPAGYKQRFAGYLKSKLSPESLPKHFDEIKGKILKSEQA
jgi:large subunit ribosomal protein L18